MNIDHLKTITKIVAHDNCPDGRASALLCHDALPEAEIIFCQYQTPLHKSLKPEPGVLFVDFTPWVERQAPGTPDAGKMTEGGFLLAKAWADAGTIVLDHHKGAADLVKVFGERGVFADEKAEPGVSGAVLAYREVWAPLEMARLSKTKKKLKEPNAVFTLARLAGVRDTWQTANPDWAASGAQAAALMFYPWEKLLSTVSGGGLTKLASLMEIGPLLVQRDYARDTKSIQEAYRFEFAGKKFVCFDGLHTSDIAERLGEEADMVVGWHYLREEDGLKMVFSCRSRGDFSALDFAKAHGGGGHRQAAGFKIPVKPENTAAMLVPYGAIELLIGKYLEPDTFPGLKNTVASGAAIAASAVIGNGATAPASPPG